MSALLIQRVRNGLIVSKVLPGGQSDISDSAVFPDIIGAEHSSGYDMLAFIREVLGVPPPKHTIATEIAEVRAILAAEHAMPVIVTDVAETVVPRNGIVKSSY